MNSELTQKLINMENAALDRWNNGDPTGFLEISADDVTYFDSATEQRVDGIKNLTKLYEERRGTVKVDMDEMINPIVNSTSEMAVLSFNLISHIGDKHTKWNCSEVYRLQQYGDWKIVQTHWSLVNTRTN
jgi:ketosteroid isomerase-like protein